MGRGILFAVHLKEKERDFIVRTPSVRKSRQGESGAMRISRRVGDQHQLKLTNLT